MQNDDYDRYHEVGKQHANWYQAELVNQEIQRKSSLRTGGSSLGFFLFIATVIFFKPVAEYCIELYGYLASYIGSFLAFFGI